MRLIDHGRRQPPGKQVRLPVAGLGLLVALVSGAFGPTGPAAADVVRPGSDVIGHAGRPASATSLPGGRPYFVVSLMGGSYNRYWVRLAQYTFSPGPAGTGDVRQSYWMWYQSSFSGNARTNKITTGFVTAGCAAACSIRTPRGFQPGTGPMATLSGRYRFDRNRRLIITWPGHRIEAWTVLNASPTLTRLTLHHTTFAGLYGDALGSTAPFTTVATRDQVAATHLTGHQRVASYGARGRYPVRTSRWTTSIVAPMHRCAAPRSACLLHTSSTWRSALAVPGSAGRRAYWQHQRQGNDGFTGPCFSAGGGHTVALLQALDDRGRFAGFVGAEASLNGRSRHNAVIGQLLLT